MSRAPGDPSRFIALTSHQIFIVLCAAILVLVLMGTLTEFLAYLFDSRLVRMLDRMFDLDRESNIPTWVSSSLLLIASLQAFATAQTKIDHAGRFRMQWVLLGGMLLFLSADEAAMIHEQLGSVVLGASNEQTSPLLRNKWVILYGLGLVPLAVIYLRFVLLLPSRPRLLVVIAGVAYVGGALGLEFFESAVQGPGERVGSTALFLLTTAQEAAEMLGVAILIFALHEFRTGTGLNRSLPSLMGSRR